jgi:hypothetical protein
MAEAASEIAVAPTTDRPDVWKTVARIVARAGYALPSREMVMA